MIITNSVPKSKVTDEDFFMRFEVQLTDVEQYVINCPIDVVYDRYTPAFSANHITVSEYRKYLIKEIHYEAPLHRSDVIVSHFVGHYFLKNSNKLGKRVTYMRYLTDEVLKQLPDSVHKTIREYLEDESLPRLQKIVNTGLVVSSNTKIKVTTTTTKIGVPNV